MPGSGVQTAHGWPKRQQLLLCLLALAWQVMALSCWAASPESARASLPRNVQFFSLATGDGLSQAAVNAVVQDQQGFMWFGTQEGLDRYDGYDFKSYHHDTIDAGSLSNDWVWTLLVDRSGRLWVGSDGGGLSRYLPDSDSFIHYRHNPDNPTSLANDRVRAIYEDRSGVLWIGTDGGGLSRLDPQTGRFKNYSYELESQASSGKNKVFSVRESRDGRLWVGTDGAGLVEFDRLTERFVPYASSREDAPDLGRERVRTIYEDAQGRLWIGTYDAGVKLLDLADGSIRALQNSPSDPHSLSHNEVRSVFQDADGTIWVGTDHGLNEWRPAIQGFVAYRHDPAVGGSLVNNRIMSIYQDRGDVLWIGTFGGVSRWNYLSDDFLHIVNDLGNNLVTSVREASDANLWVGTYGGGLNRLNPLSGESHSYRHDPADPKSLSDNRVMSVFAASNEVVWVGTRAGGLNRLDVNTGHFTRYEHDPKKPASLSALGVTSIYAQDDSSLWVGTYGGGLNRLDIASGQFQAWRHDPNDNTSISSDRVLSIVRSRTGTLWIATEDGGLNEFDPRTYKFTRYQHQSKSADSLSSDTAWEVLEGQDGSLWVATRDGGLNRWHPGDRKAGNPVFRHYGKAEGLVSNAIYGVLEDRSGMLWLSGNRGLTRFNPETEEVRHFDTENGLRSNEFNYGARTGTASGSLVFGGSSGLVIFDPLKIRTNYHQPQVAVTAISRMDPVAYGHSETAAVPVLNLDYRDYAVSFEFTALDFSSSDKNQYRYLLEGFDKQWLNPGRFRRTTYTNLPAGDYVFKVKASNNEGIWSSDVAAIGITVQPPPWKSDMAYLSYALLAMALLGLTVRNQINRLRRAEYQRIELEKQVLNRTEELATQNRNLEKLTRELEQASITDPLTGLYNRRYLNHHITTELAALERGISSDHENREQPLATDLAPGLALIMIDLDGFKPINDNFGHHAGDRALQQVRDILLKCCRGSDTIVRWGGDEFLIVGRQASRRGAEKQAERLRQGLAEHQYQVGTGQVARLSGSIGVAMMPFAPSDSVQLSWEQVVSVADQAAYLAKQNGRNAWVALYGARELSGADAYERISTSLESMVQRGEVQVKTSLDKPLQYDLKVRQRNA